MYNAPTISFARLVKWLISHTDFKMAAEIQNDRLKHKLYNVD